MIRNVIAFIALLVIALSNFPALPAYAQEMTRLDNDGAQVVPRIIGGQEAAPRAWPSMVALVAASVTDSTEAQFCGGTLIASRYVLTAAHCLFDHFDDQTGEPVSAPAYLYQVMHGTDELPFDYGNRTEVVGAVIHPQFNSVTLENDFALIKLAKDLPPPYMAQITAADSKLWVGKSISGTTMGWGIASNFGAVLPTRLQTARIPVKVDEDCLDNLGRLYKPDTMVCGGKIVSEPGAAGGINTCNGDSGGPLVISDGDDGFKQLGVVSWGLTQECAGIFYGVFSEVPSAESFIASRPIIKPSADYTPLLLSTDYDDRATGVVPVGSTLVCFEGTWLGDPIDSTEYSWYRTTAAGDEQIPGEFRDYFFVSEEDAGSKIWCGITASNAGGSATSFSNSVTVADLIPPTPTVQPTATTTAVPTSTATATPTSTPLTEPLSTSIPLPITGGQVASTNETTAQQPVVPVAASTSTPQAEIPITAIAAPIDRTAPALQRIAFSCGSKVCNALVLAKDTEGNVASVTGRVLPKCGAGRSCGKVAKGRYSFKHVSGDIWRVSIPRLSTAKFKLRVAARDGMGNESRVELARNQK